MSYKQKTLKAEREAETNMQNPLLFQMVLKLVRLPSYPKLKR